MPAGAHDSDLHGGLALALYRALSSQTTYRRSTAPTMALAAVPTAREAELMVRLAAETKRADAAEKRAATAERRLNQAWFIINDERRKWKHPLAVVARNDKKG